MANKPNFKNTTSYDRLHHSKIKFNVTKRYEELNEKFKSRKMNSKEMKEYENLKKVMANLPKMDNVFKFKENLLKYQQALVNELATRKSNSEKTEKAESYMDFLEDQLKDLKDKILDANSRLKDPNISAEEKEKLEISLEVYKKKLGNNQLEFSKVFAEQSELEKSNKNIDDKFKNLSKEDLCAEIEKSSITLSKCSLYLNKLLKGETLENIKAYEDSTDWKRLVADKRQSEKLRNLKRAQKEPLSLQTQIGDFVNSVMPEQQPELSVEPQEESLENLPIEVSDFDKKHPALARFKNWFKDKFNRVTDRFRRSEEPTIEQESDDLMLDQEHEPESEHIENNEEIQHETASSQFRKSFKQQTMADYDISKIAELGQEEYEKTFGNKEQADKKQVAAKRLAENRKKLYGDSEKNMNTNISDKLNDLSNDDER